MILAFNCAFEGGDHKAFLKLQAFTLLIAYFHKMIIKILTIIACSDNTGLRDPELELSFLLNMLHQLINIKKQSILFMTALTAGVKCCLDMIQCVRLTPISNYISYSKRCCSTKLVHSL